MEVQEIRADIGACPPERRVDGHEGTPLAGPASARPRHRGWWVAATPPVRVAAHRTAA